VTGSDESGREHLDGEGGCPITDCCCAEHTQLSEGLSLRIHAVRLSFGYLMYFVLTESVCILLQINFHSFFQLSRSFYMFINAISSLLGTK
jgi:hypothetical protein